MDLRSSRTELNELYRNCEAIGLDPASVQWTEQQEPSYGDRYHRAFHKGTGAYFEMRPGSRTTRGVSGIRFEHWPTVPGERPATNAWVYVKPFLRKWLQVVKTESDAPDLWAMAHEQRSWLTSSEEAFRRNTPFTPLEQVQIARHLRTIEEYTVKTYHLNESHQAHVRAQLSYLTEAAARVGRFDWKNLAASSFIDIVLTLGLDPEKTQELLALATQLLGPLVIGAANLLSQ